MALNWALIRTYAAEYPAQPELVCRAVNRRLQQDTHAEMFVTVFYGILDPATGDLVYCNAGHNPPYLVGARDGGQARKLATTGIPLGIFEEEDWTQGTLQLAAGDTLVMYTDGLVEAQDAGQVLYGDERLLACVQANLGRPAPDIQAALLDDVHAHVGGAPQFDDITLAVLVRDLT
jgi:sigma-B regulation protein RsbU (phosphoserine phosphatase)